MEKNKLIQKYKEFKEINNKIPLRKEFLDYANINSRKLDQLYGDNAYSKFQEECGDAPNKLIMTRTPLEKIMHQYGDLALELERLPAQPNWRHKRFQPTVEALRKSPHFIKWSDFPLKFKEWIEVENIESYSKVLEYIDNIDDKVKFKIEKSNQDFERLINDIRMWSPARRRNREETYQVELRKYLESNGYSVNEEFGESNFDLLVNNEFAIEIKKDPNLVEYDRLFGQLARHLQHQSNVIALILDAPTEDKFHNFTFMVDKYLNKDDKSVEVIKK